jgi:pimeloyl-ACP methyl ester carboxylesterase
MNATTGAPDQQSSALEGGVQSRGQYVHANGIDIYYVEAGQGEPLVLLHGGVVTTNPIWAGVPVAYASHMDTLAQHFRVIAPDTRGCGRTLNATGDTITYSLLADDVAALIEALDLHRPAICGFSDGGLTASTVGIRHPNVARAIVNDAGYDFFNPTAPSFVMMRQILGGSPDATEPDPDALEAFFSTTPEMRPVFELLKADEDGAQGPGYWRTYVEQQFYRTTHPMEYSVDDFSRITAPTLIMAGDRDEYCTPEEGVAAYRTLQKGELAILPGIAHYIPPQKIQLYIDFLQRHPAA